MRKARNANKSFLAGTAVLFVAVFAVVLIFLFWGFSLSDNKEERQRKDVFRFVITDDFRGQDLAVWLGDSLIASHAHAGDTLTHTRLADETTLLLVDNATDHVTLIPVSARMSVTVSTSTGLSSALSFTMASYTIWFLGS